MLSCVLVNTLNLNTFVNDPDVRTTGSSDNNENYLGSQIRSTACVHVEIFGMMVNSDNYISILILCDLAVMEIPC